jgi:transketolase
MLAHVPERELARIRALDGDPVDRAAAFADACRLNALYSIMRAGSGHPGTSLSCMDVLAWLHLEELADGDRYFSSKGHDAPALYAVLTALGVLPFEGLHGLRRAGGLPGHPDVVATPAVHTSTGSLGMGISKAKGFIRADRLAGRRGRVFVLTGDGELQEGQFWESLPSAVHEGMGELVAIVDRNGLQSDTFVAEVSDLGDLEAKVGSFGWAVASCDGNDVADLARSLGELLDDSERPKLLVANTRKGAGVSFMELHEPGGLYGFHSGAPSADEWQAAAAELRGRLDARLAALGAEPVVLTADPVEVRPQAAARTERLLAAYGDALVAAAARDDRIVALDADLVLDTGLVPFRERFPDRFVECGIAEQDMVSQAGAMALAGLLPVVHSFACFLSTRPNEQIYNNATEGTRVVYAGSLAGIVPGGPGHSHQSVRDISALGAVPGLTLVEPFCEAEARALVGWALTEAPGSVYIRLVSVPWPLGFEPPAEVALEHGRGTLVRDGTDVLIAGTGPVLLSQAWAAAELLGRRGVDAGVLAIPWLRSIDAEWLLGLAAGRPLLCLDNHLLSGGQGEAVRLAVGDALRVEQLGVEGVPVCGTHAEVLRAHGLDAAGIAAGAEQVAR